MAIYRVELDALGTDNVSVDLSDLKSGTNKDLSYNVTIRQRSANGAYTYIVQASADNNTWVPLTNGNSPITVTGQSLNPYQFLRISFTDTSGAANTIQAVVLPFVVSVQGGAGAVDSFNGRIGIVVAVASDYDASQVDNDSGVAGANVAAALDTLAALPHAVNSVFSRIGAVVAANNDYTWAQINKAVSDLNDLTTKSHTSLTDKGANTHPQIDTHLGSTANPHSVGFAQAGAIEDGANTVKDTHIDWGVGAGQVSAVDTPIADVGVYYTGTEVEAALQEIGDGTTLDSRYVNEDGDTMTGVLIISPTIGDDQLTLKNNEDATGARQDAFTFEFADGDGGCIKAVRPSAGSKSDVVLNMFAGGDLVTRKFQIEEDGTLNVAQTTDYEDLVTSEDDIPNKKFCDDTYPLRSEWEQNGIADRADSTLAFNDGTRVFTINRTGASFDYFVMGFKFTVTTDDQATVNTVTLTDDEGLWVIYYDGAVLTALRNPSDAQFEAIIATKCLVGLVYYDATNNLGILYDERHDSRMGPTTHQYLHETVGLAYANGLGLGDFVISDGDDNEDAQFSIAAGECHDEDLEIDLNAINKTTGDIIFYRNGVDWRWDTQSGFKCRTFDGTNATRLAYDNGGVLTEVSNNDFVLVHVFATNAYDGNPISIIGQAEYANRNAARDGAETEITNLILGTLPSKEMKPIASVIYQTNDGYGNDVNAKVLQTESGDNYVDWRTSQLSAGVAAADHGSLGGLSDDDHDIYLLAGGSRALAGAWDMGNQALTNVNMDTGNIAAAVVQTDWDAAFAHKSNNGSDHGYIDQDVTGGSSPTFASIVFTGRIQGDKGGDVASADEITLGADGNYFDITGVTTINHINKTDWQAGSVIILQFDGAITVTHSAGGAVGTEADIILGGGGLDFGAQAGDTLQLVYDGVTFREVSRMTIA